VTSTTRSVALLAKTVTPLESPSGIVAAFDSVSPASKLIDDESGRTAPWG
jgi:hypothetical protein